MKRKIIRTFFSVAMIMITLTRVNYTEASSFKFSANADKTEVLPGEDVIIEMKVSDINMGKYGVNVVEGYLDYDKDFFKDIELIDENDWKITYNSEDGERKGKFLVSKIVDGVTQEETIEKIRVTVRDDITKGEGQIRIKQVRSNDEKNLVDEGDRIITIKIKEDEKENSEDEEEQKTPNTPPKEEDNIDKETSTEGTNVKTGDGIFLLIGVILTAVFANIIVMPLNKRKDK